MSDIPTQHESAVAVVRKQVCELDTQIQSHGHKLELATAQRDILLDLIAARLWAESNQQRKAMT